MLIVFDIGNTNVVCGVYENKKLIADFRVMTNTKITEDELGTMYLNLFKINKIDFSELEGVIVSSVVPSINTAFSMFIKKYLGVEPIMVGPGLKSGIKIKIENPKSLGADLLTGLVGAYEKYPTNLIVIDLGTATKLLVLTANKEFIGGIISPGVLTSLNALSDHTSSLPYINLEVPKKVVGTDTIACMQSGVVYGTASMIDGLVEKINQEHPADYKVILTGGLSKYIKDTLKTEVIYEPHLLLEGLKYLFYKNN